MSIAWLSGLIILVILVIMLIAGAPIAISLAVFGLASGELSIGSSTAVDALMCLLAGMTGGIILSLAE